MSRKQVCRSAEEGSAERGAGARLRDATAEPNIGRAEFSADPCARLPGRIPTSGAPPPPYGAPHCLHGDLTAEADISGRQPSASVSGRIPIKIDVAPAPPRRPPRVVAGMRPPAIAASRRREILCKTQFVNEAAA